MCDFTEKIVQQATAILLVMTYLISDTLALMKFNRPAESCYIMDGTMSHYGCCIDCVLIDRTTVM